MTFLVFNVSELLPLPFIALQYFGPLQSWHFNNRPHAGYNGPSVQPPHLSGVVCSGCCSEDSSLTLDVPFHTELLLTCLLSPLLPRRPLSPWPLKPPKGWGPHCSKVHNPRLVASLWNGACLSKSSFCLVLLWKVTFILFNHLQRLYKWSLSVMNQQCWRINCQIDVVHPLSMWREWLNYHYRQKDTLATHYHPLDEDGESEQCASWRWSILSHSKVDKVWQDGDLKPRASTLKAANSPTMPTCQLLTPGAGETPRAERGREAVESQGLSGAHTGGVAPTEHRKNLRDLCPEDHCPRIN